MLEPKTTLCERYEIVRAIRQGGMGAVYEAVDTRLGGSACAIKVMIDRFEEGMQRRFTDEMRVLASLNHSNIPRVRDFFTEGATCFIVMDFIPGDNLEQELKSHLAERHTALPPGGVVADLLEVLDVLRYLHSHSPSIIHRDVKPANIIREQGSGRVMLVDFGLARVVDDAAGTQTSIGTLEYAPLEQVQGHAEPRSDLYSLGATAFHLLTGRVPTPLARPNLRQTEPALDETLAAIVERSMATVPADRFATASDMREALAVWRDGWPIDGLNTRPLAAPTAASGPQDTLIPTVGGRTTKSPGAAFDLRAFALSLGLVLAIGLGLFLPGWMHPPPLPSHFPPPPPEWFPVAPSGWQVEMLAVGIIGNLEVPVGMFRYERRDAPRHYAVVAAFHTAAFEQEGAAHNDALMVREAAAQRLGSGIRFKDGADDAFRFEGTGPDGRPLKGEGFLRLFAMGPRTTREMPRGARVFVVLMPAADGDSLQDERQAMLEALPEHDGDQPPGVADAKGPGAPPKP